MDWKERSQRVESMIARDQARRRGEMLSYDAMEFITAQVNAGRAVLFSPRLLRDGPVWPYEVFVDNRRFEGKTLTEAISAAAKDKLIEVEE